ncbi:DUF397 domain-containing protein [Actinomadura geliboluensis]
MNPSAAGPTAPPSGEYVEVVNLAASVAVRDSKAPDAGHLTFDPDIWTAFVAKVQDERFNLP